MINRGVKLKKLCLLSMMVFVVSCGEWPPHESDAKRYFHDRRSSLELLRDELIKDNLIDVGTHLIPPLTGKIKEEYRYQPDLTSEQIEKYKKLLSDAGVSRIWRDKDKNMYEYDFAGGIQNGFLRYINGTVNSYSPLICLDEFKNIECGGCDIKLDEDWWLHYRWWSDFDYDGSTPFNEEEHNLQLDACFKQGYKEMKKIHLTKTSAGVGS